MPNVQQRNVSWIELFYDLVFVAAAHQLTLMLASATGFLDAMSILLLFLPVLWCWMSHTLFTNQFQDRSWFYHLMTMFTIAGTIAMVLLLPSAMYMHQAWFAMAYVLVKAAILIQYIFWSVVEIRRLLDMIPIIVSNIGSGMIWFLSIFAPNPMIWWIVGMAIDILTPILTKTAGIKNNMNPHHLPERLGLLTVIVLGEMIISLVITSFELPLTQELLLVLGAGVLITFLIFWTYFRFIDQAILGFSKSTSRIYLYSHIPLVLGLICVATGYRGVLSGNDTSYLLITGIMLYTLSQRLLRFVQDQRFLKRQLVLVLLLFPILGWFLFYAGPALNNLLVLTASFAVYLILSEFILGWETFSTKNAPTNRVQWDNDQ